MKKIIVLVLMVLMLVSLSACGESHEFKKSFSTADCEYHYYIDGELVSKSVYETFRGK